MRHNNEIYNLIVCCGGDGRSGKKNRGGRGKRGREKKVARSRGGIRKRK